MIELLIYPLVGILSGFLAGFFGVGGGIVLVPALHFLYTQMGYSDEISIPIALGTALACIVINSLSAIPVHHRNKNISWTNFYKLFIGIALGSILGAFISVGAEKDLFKKVFALFIFLISLRMFFKMKSVKGFVNIPIFQAVPFGGLVGTVSTTFGLGGGIFIGPYLKFMGENMRRAAGTSVTCTLPVGLIGAGTYIFLGFSAQGLPDYSVGYVNYLSLLCIVIFSSFSSRFGAYMTQKVNEKVFQTLYALQLVPIFLYWFFA